MDSPVATEMTHETVIYTHGVDKSPYTGDYSMFITIASIVIILLNVYNICRIVMKKENLKLDKN